MSIRKLPANASLENFRKQAKSLLKAARDNDPQTLSRVQFFFSDPKSIGLQNAQLVIARDYGFSSWQKLRLHMESDTPVDQPARDQLANEFLRLVVLVYSETETADPERFHKAAELLQKHPEVRDENIYTASACGDVRRVARWLDNDPGLIDQEGGLHQWAPLMYATYSRMPGVSTMDVGKLLLDRGANPNAHYRWGGQYLFTALTGVFGEGEAGPEKLPEHPDCDAFARLLLNAGANPNDSQAAYNRMLSGDHSCLKLLLEFGLSADAKNNWYLQEEGELVSHPQETLHYQFCHAVQTGDFEKLRLLIESGVNINKTQDGRSPYQLALLGENKAIAEYLLANGAEKIALAEVDQFRIACLQPERVRAQELLKQNPGLINAVLDSSPDILEHAIAAPHPDALLLMLELGFDVNHITYRTALHQAAWLGRIDMMQLLIDAGADPARRDHHYFGPPLAWALQNNQNAAVEFLDNCRMDIFTATAREKLLKLEDLLGEKPGLLETRFGDIRPNKNKSCEMDWMTPLAFAIASRKIVSVEFLVERGASTSVHNGKGLSIKRLAVESENDRILELVEEHSAVTR